MVTGVELGVGLSMALVTLVFFLHSNATWSLHSLWQFIPQSEKAKRMHNMSEQELVAVLTVLQMQLSELCMLTGKQTDSSHVF